MQMDGLGGLRGWQWIFIIEAIPTLLLSAAAYFFLPDFPENSKCNIYHTFQLDSYSYPLYSYH
jgi:predicted MFS family arabinose efflux permease